MKITQGTFSFLPDLSDAQIRRQIEYCLLQGFALNLEHTDEPHPRNTYWEMWNMPMFDHPSVEAVMTELSACRAAHPRHYIRLNAYNSTRGVESVALSFIINRPERESALRLRRTEVQGRVQHYEQDTD